MHPRAPHTTRRGRSLARATLLPIALVAFGLFRPTPARAQIPDSFVNLEVLRKDITRDELLTVMRGFTQALGVRCQHCHAEKAGAAAEPGRPAPLDFKADDKPAKDKARAMLRIVQAINGELLPKVPDRSDPPIRVGCVTCHHGLVVPRTLEDTLHVTLEHAGLAAAQQEYRDLRKEYYGSGVFDFRPARLIDLARRVAAEKRVPDALAFLSLNAEFYPEDAGTYFAMGDLYRESGDKARALESYRKVLELQPNDRAAQRRIQELSGGGGR